MLKQRATGLIFGLLFLFCGHTAHAEAEPLQVLFVNVGKADAAIVRYGGYTCVVDTGTKDSFDQFNRALNYLQVQKINDVFLSHTHNDHTGGFKKLSNQYPIERMLHSNLTELTDKGKNRFVTLSEKNDVPHETLLTGTVLTPCPELKIEVLGPLTTAKDDNDMSLVLRFSIYGKSVLFTGDAQFVEEYSLLSSGCDLRADVLKVGNHGNPDATSEAFAAAVSPQISIISTDTGKDADSANPRVLQALRGSQCYLTQNAQLGVLVTITSDGGITVEDINE